MMALPTTIEAIEKEIKKLENQKYRIEKEILRLEAKKQDMLSTPTNSEWLSDEQIDAIDFSFIPGKDTSAVPISTSLRLPFDFAQGTRSGTTLDNPNFSETVCPVDFSGTVGYSPISPERCEVEGRSFSVDVKDYDYEPKITIGLMEPAHTKTVKDTGWSRLKLEIKGSSTPWLYDVMKDKQPISDAEILILKKLGRRFMYVNQLSDATGYHVATIRKYTKMLVEKKYIVAQREYIQDAYTFKWGSRNVWHIPGCF